MTLGKAARPRCPKCAEAGTDSCPECRRHPPDEGREPPPATRQRMEQGFGGPVPDDLRLHDGPGTDTIARHEGVRAFAVGHDIGFAAGEFRPSTIEGDAMLAHELAHTLQSDGAGASPTSDRAQEADADRVAGGVVSRLLGVTSTAPARPQSGGGGLALRGCDGDKAKVRPGQGLDTGLAPGTDTKGYTLDQYIRLWERQQGRKMTDEEKKRLAAGCVGVTRTNLGGAAVTDDCYKTFDQARKRADELEKAHGVRPFIFSKRLWSMGRPFPADAGGKVDMTNDRGDSPPGEVNFDYGWYDEKSDTWWHANHCDPLTGSDRCRVAYPGGDRMKVYQSTLGHYSDPNYFGADVQVFCVAWSKL